MAKLSSLSREYLDHNPLILDTKAVVISPSKTIRFDKTWLAYGGFFFICLLLGRLKILLTSDLGLSWKLKMQFLCRKLRGSSSNERGKRRVKSSLMNRIGAFQQNRNNNCLS